MHGKEWRTLTDEIMPKEHWEDNAREQARRLPIIVDPAMCFDEHRLHQKYLGYARSGTVFEVGCSPGRWLAYFSKHFSLRPSGIDYVNDSAELTRQNLKLQGISSDIIQGDFIDARIHEQAFDVVFSRGFIEHFRETQPVVDRIASLARSDGLVITTVPNMLGVNGLIRRWFLRASYDAHLKLSSDQLQELHETAGLKTCFCNYGGVPCVILPWDVCSDSRRPTGLKCLIDFFKRALNRLSREVCIRSGCVFRSKYWSPTIIYIGKKKQ